MTRTKYDRPLILEAIATRLPNDMKHLGLSVFAITLFGRQHAFKKY